MRIFKIIMFFILSLQTTLAQRIIFQGVVYDEDRNTVQNFTFRITSLGEVTTTNSGEFRIEIPNGTKEVEISSADNAWIIVYPFDKRIPIPADQNYISKILVRKKTDVNSSSDFSKIRRI